MADLLPRDTLLGDVELLDVFIRYDGPRLFGCRNRSGQYFVGIFVAESDDTEQYAYFPVSTERYRAFRSGGIGIRALMTNPEGPMIFVLESDTASGAVSVSGRHVRDVPADWLPTADVTLRLDTPTLEPFTPAAIAERAAAENRTLVAIELDSSNRRTEYPLRPMANVMRLVQDNVDALGQEIAGSPTGRGPVEKAVLDDAELSYIDTLAASFVILMAPRTDDRLVEIPLARRSVGRLLDIVDAGGSHDALRDRLQGLHSRAVNRYRALLEELEDDGSGMSLTLATTSGEVRTAALGREEVPGAVQFVRSLVAAQTETRTVTGALIGVNIRTNVFELLESETGERYSGRVLPATRAKLSGLTVGNRYQMVIEVETEYSAVTGEATERHRLLDVLDSDSDRS